MPKLETNVSTTALYKLRCTIGYRRRRARLAMSKRAARGAGFGDLVELTPELAETLVSVAGDIVLVIDHEGVIRQVAFSGSKSPVGSADDWVGQHWSQTVTSDTREKVELLLNEVATTGLSRARQVNHPSDSGSGRPLHLYRDPPWRARTGARGWARSRGCVRDSA